MSQPLILDLGPIQVHAYTVCMLAAIVIVGALACVEAKRRHRWNDDVLTVGVVGLLGGILGAKLGMIVFLGSAEFWRQLPTLPNRGAAFTGALFGGYLAVVLAERGLRIDRCTGDLVAPFLPFGQAIGRLGNFLAADAYGLPTSLPWGIYQAGAWRHPVQLYELVLDVILGVILWRRRLTSFRDGELFRLYVVGYALIRFPIEFLRYQPTPVPFLGLTLVQWLCVAGVLGFGSQVYLSKRGIGCGCGLLPARRSPTPEGGSAR